MATPSADHTRQQHAVRAIPAAITALACASLVPAVVNGDGLGHLRAALSGALAPGHLLFLPLLRHVADLAGAHDALALLGPARALCIASAALAAALTAGAVYALLDGSAPAARRDAALVAGCGLGLSYGVLQAGADVETYAPALAASALAVFFAAHRARDGSFAWSVAAALAVALAALLHVENVLLAPAAALLCAIPRNDTARVRRADLAVVLLVSGAAVLGCYALAARARGDDLAGAIGFVRSASHGFAYPLRPWTPIVAVYGAARAIIDAPYPGDAGWARVLAQSFLGVVAAAAMIWLGRRPGRPRTLGRRVALAWAIPYALVGVVYFASDNERWIFLLPPAWIVAAAGLASKVGPAPRRRALLLLAGIAACNLAFALPEARDATRRDLADAAAAELRPGDLVVSPGHGWDEYIGFYRTVAVEPFPMVYFCGVLGGADPMAAELRRHVGWARKRGGRVFAVRLGDPATSPGWKDLVPFGVTPETVDRWLPPGRRVQVTPELVRIDPE